MVVINSENLAARFMRYVQVDTQSDPQSDHHPTTEKQKDLSRLLLTELLEMGIKNAELDEYGYIYASIPSNSKKNSVPAICFCSHVDTAPDCSGTHVKPLLHKNYDGRDIVLPDDSSQVLKISDYTYLKEHIGSDIITASGNTLLGADDKAGVAIIMEAAAYLLEHPESKHGDIKIVFTPDEEVGKGTAKIDMQKVGAQFGYTMDGGEAGSLEDETFSADSMRLVVDGIISHPGYAKDKLVNAIKVAGAILDALPKNEWAPEVTEKKQGFIHPVRVEGIAEKASIEFIVRDFDTAKLKEHEERLKQLATEVVKKFPGAKVDFQVTEQYRNMKEVLDKNPQVVQYAADAIRRAGLKVKTESIRGGTDGSKLSFMGLPCPNIFTGMQAIHSRLEWIGLKDMVKSAETIVHLCMIWEEKS